MVDPDEFTTVSASLRRNPCFDYTKKDPTLLKGFLERAWETMVIEAFEMGGDPQHVATARRWFDRLWDLHTADPGRHYHTIVHVWEMTMYLMLLMKVNDVSCGDGGTTGTTSCSLTQQQPNVICLAIFFHDAVYDPQSSSNEEDSARLFEEFATESALSVTHPEITNQVVQFILDTKRHQVSDSNPVDLALFLDMDMAVLGKDPEAYQSYAGLIRREYRYVPRELYCAKRAEILTEFLQQPQLYGTGLMRRTLEEQARENVQAEIVALRAGIIYGETAAAAEDADKEARLQPATGPSDEAH